jgi:hypothetical protein
MNKREAKRLADEDNTPYAVWLPNNGKGGGGALIHVSGYTSARVVQGRKPDRPILTASEAKLAQTDRAGFLKKLGR